jgi:hypothetical protein
MPQSWAKIIVHTVFSTKELVNLRGVPGTEICHGRGRRPYQPGYRRCRRDAGAAQVGAVGSAVLHRGHYRTAGPDGLGASLDHRQHILA